MIANILTTAAVELQVAAGVPGRRIAVTSIYLVGIGAAIARFKTGSGGGTLSGEMIYSGSDTARIPLGDGPYFLTNAGDGLYILSDTNAVSGFITYEVM